MDIGDMLDKYGIPLGLLTIFIYASWKSGTWLATEVVKPFITNMIQTQKTMGEAVAALCASSKETHIEVTESRKDLITVREALTRSDLNSKKIKQAFSVVAEMIGDLHKDRETDLTENFGRLRGILEETTAFKEENR